VLGVLPLFFSGVRNKHLVAFLSIICAAAIVFIEVFLTPNCFE
jgi:hypothetical protein